jgi:hypothetical protein
MACAISKALTTASARRGSDAISVAASAVDLI